MFFLLDIILSVNNREEVLVLPVLPPEFTVSKPQANETFETVSSGQLKLIGNPSLKSISWNSFFPVRDYPFLHDRSNTGFGYAYIIDTWIGRKLPIRLVITETPINMACCVDDFSYTIKKDGDMNYSITLGEVPLL